LCGRLNRCFHLLSGELAGIKKRKEKKRKGKISQERERDYPP
jgi:hypothetical protein